MKSKFTAAADPIINQHSYLPNWREMLQALPAQPASRRKGQRVIDFIVSVVVRKEFSR
jgi:hypothetical protein